ncbi:hypothetical protein ACRQU7_13270 [Caproiciproducens sp. R1]|uniref:hypothetical protein n=1 Tax=Caproiciproducens sp. R1 TaxID=3435000 RepID=UPI00056F2F3C
MSRGTQKTDEERLQILDEEIAKLESRKIKMDEKIEGFNKRKEAILNQQKQKKLEELQKFISKSGKSPEEILEMIKRAG